MIDSATPHTRMTHGYLRWIVRPRAHAAMESTI